MLPFSILSASHKHLSTTAAAANSAPACGILQRNGGQEGGGQGRVQQRRILFQSLGCPRNTVDTEVMIGNVLNSNSLSLEWELTQDLQEADYIVVNTCGFLQTAREESTLTIPDFVQQKQSHTKIIVTGCLVNWQQQQQHQLQQQNGPENTAATTTFTVTDILKSADAVLSAGAVDQIVPTILQLEQQQQQQPIENSRIDNNNNSNKSRRSYLEGPDTPRFLSTPPHYAYLKIAEGCRKRCSFCIIPKIKGQLLSKPLEQIVNEFQAMLQASPLFLKEIILIAQNLGDYGKDFQRHQRHDHNSTTANLTTLLQALLQVTPPASNPLKDIWIRPWCQDYPQITGLAKNCQALGDNGPDPQT